MSNGKGGVFGAGVGNSAENLHAAPMGRKALAPAASEAVAWAVPELVGRLAATNIANTFFSKKKWKRSRAHIHINK